MESILEELFYGNVCPNTGCRSKDKGGKDLMAHIADHHSSLNEMLTDKQFLLSTMQRKTSCNLAFSKYKERACSSLFSG